MIAVDISRSPAERRVRLGDAGGPRGDGTAGTTLLTVAVTAAMASAYDRPLDVLVDAEAVAALVEGGLLG